MFYSKRKEEGSESFQTPVATFTQLLLPLQEGDFAHDGYLGFLQPVLGSAAGRLHQLLDLEDTRQRGGVVRRRRRRTWRRKRR